MRILHVLSGIDQTMGGPVSALAGLSIAQTAVGLDVTVLATYCKGADHTVAQTMRASGVKVSLIGPCTPTLSWHPTIRPTVKRLVDSADVVHIHALFEEVQHQAACAARRQRVPYVFRPCGMLDPWSLRQSRLKKRLYMALRLKRDLNGAAALHYTAELERDGAALLGLKPVSIVEPNGVDLSEFQTLPPPGSFRARHPMIGDRALVLFLGRLHPKKGIPLLLSAFAKGAPDEAILAIVGPGEAEYQRKLEQLARSLGLQDRVLFTGMLRGEQRVAALADADLFVLSSHQENFGIAVIEALAAGTPVIVSDQVNIYREITAAEVGAAVPLETEALASELRLWMNNHSLRAAAAERCRPFVWTRYDWQQIARRWVQHYHVIATRKIEVLPS